MMELMKESKPPEKLIQNVDRVLSRHVTDFASLFAIKPPSQDDRNELQKCSTDGTYLKRLRGTHVIPYALVDEAIILSNMFQMNEFVALDLLTIAERELDNYPDWPRGLVAVVMFYEGRLWLMQALCAIIRCSPGHQWKSVFHQSILASFRRVLNVFSHREDVIDRYISLLQQFNVDEQMDLLEKNQALGDPRHRRKVKHLLTEITSTLAQTIFCYAAQQTLSWPELSRILEYLKTKINPEAKLVTKDDVALIASIIYTMDTTLCSSNTNVNIGRALGLYVQDNMNGNWKCTALYELLRLALSVVAHKLTKDANMKSSAANFVTSGNNESESLEMQELLRSILENGVGDHFDTRNLFTFLQQEIFSVSENYTGNPDIAKVFHGFLVDFIVYMPHKLKQMQLGDDESVRNFVLDKTPKIGCGGSNVMEYGSFMECLGEFYQHDPFQLAQVYFAETGECIPLSILPKKCCFEMIDLFPSCMKFLTGLITGGSQQIFELLRNRGHNASLDDFIEMLEHHLNNIQSGIQGQCTRGTVSTSTTAECPPVIDPQQLRSMYTYVRLIELLCGRNENVRSFVTRSKANWIRTLLLVAKSRCFPRVLRAAILDACAAMIGAHPLDPEVVYILWNTFYSVKLIDPGKGDLKEELEEEEVRLGDYSVTVGMLRLLNALIKTRFRQMEYISEESHFIQPTSDKANMLPYLNYVKDTVFLKMSYRCFKDLKQRWSMIQLSTEILSSLLDVFPKLMSQFMVNSPLMRSLLGSVIDGYVASSGVADCPEINKCNLAVLRLLRCTLQRQQFYLSRREICEPHGVRLIESVHKLMESMGPTGNTPQCLLGIVRFVDCMLYSTQHVQIALEILTLILENHPDTDYALLRGLYGNKEIATVFKHTVVEMLCLNGETTDEETQVQKVKISALKLIRTSLLNEDPGVGFFLLGFDVGRREYARVGPVLCALMENASTIPTSFLTLEKLLTDPRLDQATLAVLQSSHFFHDYIKFPEVLQSLDMEELEYFLKCLAIAIKTEEDQSQVAQELVGPSFGRLEELLGRIFMPGSLVEFPQLKFFSEDAVKETAVRCEYVDKGWKAKLIRVEKLNELLRQEIKNMEKNTVLRLGKAMHSEVNDIVNYVKNINSCRVVESRKQMAFHGWRQVVEVLALDPNLKKMDFISNMLRVLIFTISSSKSSGQQYTDNFSRLVAETTLTLCALIDAKVDKEALSERQFAIASWGPVITHLCEWLRSEKNSGVRGIIYACLLYGVNFLSEHAPDEIQRKMGQSLFEIVDTLCTDCCQGVGEPTRMEGLYLMGEMIKCTALRGLGGSHGKVSINSEKRESRFLDNEESRTMLGGDEDSIFEPDLCSTRIFSDLDDKFNKIGAQSCSYYGNLRRFQEIGGICRIGGGDSSYRNPSIIMNCIFRDGFLDKLVDDLRIRDDIDLVAVLNSDKSSEQGNNTTVLRPFFVFEAKLTMLSRVAEIGPQATVHLLNTNLIKTLLDMEVFRILSLHQPIHHQGTSSCKQRREEEAEVEIEVLYSHGQRQGKLRDNKPLFPTCPSSNDMKGSPSDTTATTGTSWNPECGAAGNYEDILKSYIPTFIESLHTLVFQLFHGMLHSAPNNAELTEQIRKFLDANDRGIGNLLSTARIMNRGDSPSHSSLMLTSLIIMLTRNQQQIQTLIPPYIPQVRLRRGLLNVLRLHEDGELNYSQDEILLNMVKHVLLYMYYCSKMDGRKEDNTNANTNKSNVRRSHLSISCPVITRGNLRQEPDENVSLAVIILCVCNAARNIVNVQGHVKKPPSPSEPQHGSSTQSSTSFLRESTSLIKPIASEDTQSDLVTVVEVGLTVIYSHIQLFLAEYRENKEVTRRDKLNAYLEFVKRQVNTVAAACQKVENMEYIDTLLLKIKSLTANAAAAEEE